jgi:hypothetical protein
MSDILSSLQIEYIKSKIKRRDIKSVLSALTTGGSSITNETDPIYTASSWYTTTNNSTNWNTAFGWGNHATQGYLTSLTGAWLLSSGGTLTGNNTINQSTYTIAYDLSNIKQVVTKQISLVNSTAATSTVADQIQFSGALTFKGAAWKSNATAASQDAETYIFQRPSTGTSVITSQLLMEHWINGTYSNAVSFLSSGRINANGYGFASANTSGLGNSGGTGSITVSGGMLFSVVTPTTIAFQYTGTSTLTSTTFNYFNLSASQGFAPTSGTAVFNFWNANPTINQTGGANGISRGFYWNPTNTSVGAAQVAFKHDSGYVEWTSILSPSQITSNQNDYNPTGFNTGGSPYGASILRLSTDASRDLTGLSGGTSGRLLIISNIGSFDLVIKDESASSTAANRFALNADITLQSDESMMFYYDATSSRWRALTNA